MFRRKRSATDFNAGIEAHIRLKAERLRDQGLSEEDARATARRAFGNLTRAMRAFTSPAAGVVRSSLARHSIRSPPAAQVSRLHVCGDCNPGRGHRGQRGGL